jgi:hypothetical protein
LGNLSKKLENSEMERGRRRPVAEKGMKQLQAELPKLEAGVDFSKVNRLSADDVLHEAGTL